jgi:hypothetical protein
MLRREPEPSISRTPFRPNADVAATTTTTQQDRQKLKRAKEEAEYDVGKQKKVRRKDEWDHTAPNQYQAKAQAKESNKTRSW